MYQPVPRLTTAAVKTSPGFEALSEQEIEKYINDLEALCRIIIHVELNEREDHGYSQAA